jgi:hypothetical protein
MQAVFFDQVMAGHGNGFSFEVDVFVISTLFDKDRISRTGSVDACLDGRLVGRDVDDLREKSCGYQ